MIINSVNVLLHGLVSSDLYVALQSPLFRRMILYKHKLQISFCVTFSVVFSLILYLSCLIHGSIELSPNVQRFNQLWHFICSVFLSPRWIWQYSRDKYAWQCRPPALQDVQLHKLCPSHPCQCLSNTARQIVRSVKRVLCSSRYIRFVVNYLLSSTSCGAVVK